MTLVDREASQGLERQLSVAARFIWEVLYTECLKIQTTKFGMLCRKAS